VCTGTAATGLSSPRRPARARHSLAAGCGQAAAGGSTAQERLPDDQTPFAQLFAPGERESLLYVWTRDASGAGNDFSAVVDVDPDSPNFGTVLSTAPTAGKARPLAPQQFGDTGVLPPVSTSLPTASESQC
jgi:hypothetical protein